MKRLVLLVGCVLSCLAAPVSHAQAPVDQASPPSPASFETVTVQLQEGWTLVTWPGPSGVPVYDALQGTDPAEGTDITAAVPIVYEWDPASQSWRVAIIDRHLDAFSTLHSLRTGRQYWVGATAPVTWSIEPAGESAESLSALQAIARLRWTADGLTRRENRAVLLLEALSQRAPLVVVDLLAISRSWLPPQNPLHISFLEHVLALIGSDAELVRRLLDDPVTGFPTEPDLAALSTILKLERSTPSAVSDLILDLRHSLATDTDPLHPAKALFDYLRLKNPSLAQRFNSLDWVLDGIDRREWSAAFSLTDLSFNSPALLALLLEKPWLRDGPSGTETATLRLFSDYVNRTRDDPDASRVMEIANMSFLESVTGLDIAALESLFLLHFREATFQRVLSHPRIADGIDDSETPFVAIFSEISDDTSETFAALLDQVAFEPAKFVLELPHSGPVEMAAIGSGHSTVPLGQSLSATARSVESLMSVELPVEYLVVFATHYDETYFGTRRGIIFAEPSIADNPWLLAYLVLQPYWRFSPQWLSEGPAAIVAVHHAAADPDSALFDFDSVREDCPLLGAALEPRRPTLAAPGSEGPTIDPICQYRFGGGLFADLYTGLGDQAFLEGVRRLYHVLDRDEAKAENERECRRPQSSLCYLRASFVTGQSSEAAEIAESVIERWYFGFSLEPAQAANDS